VLSRIVVVSTLLLSGCGIPHDASHTLQNITGGTLRVGVVANEPWVIDRGATVEGLEGELVQRVAASIGARIEWVRMPEFELVRAVHDRRIQLVIGGFDPKVRWAKDVALTRPYLETPDGKAHVVAAPPGENAWLMVLDRQIELFKSQSTVRATGQP